MSRTSCIAHAPKQAMAIIRQDYYQLVEQDACSAALLNIFEYWANAVIANDTTLERPWVGARPVREFERMLLGISTDKQIRKRLVKLEARGFIQVKLPARRGEAKSYRVMVPEIQQALFGQMTEECAGQTTEGAIASWSDNRRVASQITEAASVKQPPVLRSNDRALKKSSKELKKEDQKKKTFSFEKAILDSSSKSSAAQPIKIGCVSYQQPPESIDLSELWETNPGMAKMKLRTISLGHKRLDMVAHGFGQWWIGPGMNDFDEQLIQACRNRKRKFQQGDTVADAKTYINNMLRNEDWGNLALRCEEAKNLKQRMSEVTEVEAAVAVKNCRSPFQRSEQERRDSALGLARFKMSQGMVDQALEIARQFQFSAALLGAGIVEKAA